MQRSCDFEVNVIPPPVAEGTMKDQSYRDQFWAFVTVFGTLWGGLELSLGTFLHVLHVPKTGFIMVTLSLILLLAQRCIFPARGSTLATGIVAASIKSLSPGGIILGPMFGIVTEALIVEFCLLHGSVRALPCMFAGSMALLWSQLQSLVKSWFYYGWDFIDGLVRMIEKFFKIQWTASIGLSLIAIFLGIIVITGSTAGFFGCRLGKKTRKALEEARQQQVQTEEAHLSLSENGDAKSRFPHRASSAGNDDVVRSRAILLPIALLTLCAQFSGELVASAAALLVWFTALFFGARRVLRAMWWPKFWLATLAISVLCGVMIAWNLEGAFRVDLGVEAAARMIIRGGYVFSLVGWLTRCIKPEECLKIWNKINLPELGLAMTRAFALLPIWSDRFVEIIRNRPAHKRHMFRYGRDAILSCLLDAVRQTEQIHRENTTKCE